jgi:hypothetical protein
MKSLIFCFAAFCLLSQVWGTDRELDSTLLVTKDGLTVVDGSKPIQFKCGTEWSVTFTNNGQTAELRTIDGHWTLTGLSADVAVAAVSEGAPLVSAVAGSVGVGQDDIADVTSRTLALATTLAQAIGSPAFDTALVAAVATANDVLDSNGIHPIDFNDDILQAITLLGPSGGVIDASDTTADDVHNDAKKTIGSVLTALASSGAISAVPSVVAASAGAGAGGDATAAAAAAAAGGDAGAAAAAAAAAGMDLSSMDPAALAAAAAAAGH